MKKEKKEIHLKDKKMAMKHRRDEAKMKVPMQNMAYKDDPPAFVTVVGSKSSGKSTLIKALVKKLSKNTLENVLGPVTLTVNKDKRITIFECQPDIHQFVDTSKISDLVIFVIDARVGLEMETFEYINLLMSHGLPKLLFVVTHCDKKNNQDMLKKIKKRIWSEVCDGLKFFYLGLENKKYTEIEFLNLVRSIKGMKYRPIEWKCSHPHIIVDNIDENHVYGYVRGGSIRKNIDVHIPGSDDTKISDFEILEDPVPIKTEGRLSSRRDILYGPMSFKEPENDEEEKSEGELDFNFNNEIKLFKQSSAPVIVESDSESEEVPVEINEKEITKPKLEKIENDSPSELTDIDKLKDLIKNKFRKNAENEEEWVDKFNSKYEENFKNVENFIEKQREEILAKKEKNLENKTKDVAFPGDYLKIKLEDPISVDVDFTKILVLGVLNISETTETVLQGKVKKSKWHKKLLKTNEPYIFSLGWRRFQSIPVFSSKTSEINRMLKYSFQHGFSAINFYGSVVPPGTGFSIYSETGDFRILGQGTILDATGDHKLVKKLKLVGYPKSITGNTVVVKSMFTSDLEVLKFKYGKLKTASGLKGIIKNAIGKKGDFRASFEGEMLSNDIIILRCYVDFPVYEHILPVNDLYEKWKGLRSLKEIRDELGIKIENNFEEDLESEEESNEQVYEDEFKLSSDIEKELPLDKRQLKVVNERIELPIAPENKKKFEETKRLEALRKEKDKQDLIKQNREKEVKEKEYDEYMKIKEEKKKKKIVESALDKQKRQKGFKKKRR
ncbi:Ribosome biogenesis protein BMS1 [Nosema bombycis CQ1]|uniref:Ribosome biogenesis protein BMS1 n=1 Tax=Nosema bombycis (strain CQ1 / CVCC 102059) TaxID=578461 RepID=R0M212_NOSB1|nr:Ribosome biogenesis protein BMS1 [Nosema bombycis CQ1]|eukprot:EOB12069.1 Ribosome biogenesis protein BMS1 [Nosema bombycis CQ1]